MNSIKENLHLQRFTVNKRVHSEFQDIGVELQKHFGKPLWHLFKMYDYREVKRALEICKQKENKKVEYLIGILKRI